MIESMSGLNNARILRIQKSHDYWQIMTDRGIINIYNPVRYCTETGSFLDLEHLQFGDIVNHAVTNIIECEKRLCFELDNDSSVIISLANSDYCGPEAFDIHLDSGTIIVG
jgi:hypothetical protein